MREIHTKAGLCAPPVGEHVPPGSQIADPSRADEQAFHIPPIRSSHVWQYARLTSFLSKKSFEMLIRRRFRI